MTKKTYGKKIKKEDFGEKFADALNEVLMPALSGMHDDILGLKKDVGSLKSDVAVLKSDVAVLKSDVKDMGERLEHVDNRVEMFARQSLNVGDYHSERLENHEKRIKKLERSVLGGKPDKES